MLCIVYVFVFVFAFEYLCCVSSCICTKREEKERNVGKVKGCLRQSGIDAPAKSVSRQSVACPVTHTHTPCSQIQTHTDSAHKHEYEEREVTQMQIHKYTNANIKKKIIQMQIHTYEEKKLYKCTPTVDTSLCKFFQVL